MFSPRITAAKDEIAKTVILFGDPTRAHDLAYKYLDNVKKVSDVRYACYYTGEYKGKRFTFGTSGMGAPSAAIYAHELYNNYDVERIIRAGSCGAYSPWVKTKDTVLVKEVFSETTTWSDTFFNGEKMELLPASQPLYDKLKESAKKLGFYIPEVRAHTLDVLYYTKQTYKDMMAKSGADVVEMEAYVLFFYAKLFNKQAGCLLSVVNSLYPAEEGEQWLSLDNQDGLRCASVETILNADL